MLRLHVLILCASFVCLQTIGVSVALDWNRYTNQQLLTQKERAKAAGNQSLIKQLEQVLSDRGIVSTITLAQAPEGQEWVLRNKKMVLEQRADGPTTPPTGAGSGQWVFVDPSWLYLEKDSGNILDFSGTRIGKIGELSSTQGGIAPAIAQALQEAVQRETRAKEQAEKLLSAERAQYVTQRQQLEAKIEELEKKAEQTVRTGQPTTATESTVSSSEVKNPEEVVPPIAPSDPEITPSIDGIPETPEAPPAPDAPDAPPAPGAPGAPDAPGFGLDDASEKSESTMVLAPLLDDELIRLSAEQTQTSDQFFIATIQKINNAFAQNIDNEPYITIIKKEFTTLRNNLDFYKRAELDQLIEKGIQECLSTEIDAQAITTCLKKSYNKCLFDAALGASFVPDLQAAVETMTTTSDELFKKALKTCTSTFPQNIDNRSYANMILDAFKKLDQDKNFHKKSTHKFAIATLIKALQNLSYDPENPTLYLEDFNAEKEAYFTRWIVECKKCLFDITDDTEMADDIRWIISFVVAAGRGERDIQEFANSTSAQKISDLVIADVFILSDPTAATVENAWLPALRDVLTNPSFLKPYGLMISYGARASFSVKNINQPIMQILTQPTSKTIKDPALAFINSVISYLVFDSDKTKLDLNRSKVIINEILLKPRIQKAATTTVVQTPETIGSSFAPHVFANKTLMQVIELLEKVKTKPNALRSALDLMKNNQGTSETITRLLTNIGFSLVQIADIQKVLANHEKHFALMKHLIQHMKEYDVAIKKSKNSGYKNGKQLYEFIKREIKDPKLIETFESIDRESDAVYSALAAYLKAIPNTFTKTIPASLFRKTIEPYGILIKTLEAFNTDINAPESKNKALTRLTNSITALNTGKLSAGTDYPDIITASKDSIENQALYKGQLETALQALTNNKFDEFLQTIDTFVAQSGTIAAMADDDSVIRSPAYDLIIKTFQEAEGSLLINDIKRILEAINQASYKLPGFEQDSLENLNALIQLKGKLTPIIKLLGTSLASLKLDEYKQKYTDMINADEFLKTAKMAAATKINLKKSLLDQLDALTARIQTVQAKKLSTEGAL